MMSKSCHKKEGIPLTGHRDYGKLTEDVYEELGEEPMDVDELSRNLPYDSSEIKDALNHLEAEKDDLDSYLERGKHVWIQE